MNDLKGSDLISFVNGITSYSSFEGLVLPQLLKFCSSSSPLQTMPMLADLVLKKRPLPMSLEDLLNWAPYTLDFSFSL